MKKVTKLKKEQRKLFRFENLKEELARLNITQSELARILGLERATINQWIRRGSVYGWQRFKNELLGLGFRIPR